MPDQRELSAILLSHGYAGKKKIGEGSFGMALLVEDGESHQAVCKVVDISRASQKEVQETRREARLLAQIKHPYIVRYRENFADRGWFCIVMDFCDGGDLTSQIDKAKERKQMLEEKLVLRWLTQSVLALKYLHSRKILHRDLKPANIFMTKNGDVRLGDFGISKVMACTAAFARTVVGTPYYLSPEVIQEKPYSWPADIWSMGCILYQMCSLKVPFDAMNITGLAQKILKAPIPQTPGEYSDFIRETQLHMMARSQGSRPSADEIINKSVIQDVVRAMLSEAQGQQKKDDSPTRAKYEVMDQFQKFDQNGDGVIDRQELGRVLKHLDAKVWTDESIGQIMLVADVNQDGRIQFDEFLLWVFGSDGRAGIAQRAQQLIDLARVAVDNKELDELQEHLLGWRQYVDMGCLRTSAPELCVKTCEAVAAIAAGAASTLETAKGGAAFDAVRQLRAILQSVEQLLLEYGRARVEQVAAVSSKMALRGFATQLADGLRYGRNPGGLSLNDADLESLGAQWERLQPGERIVEVRGWAVPAAAPAGIAGRRSPSPDRGDSLAACLVLCTSYGRELVFGSQTQGHLGTPFSFKAPEGCEVESVNFGPSGNVLGIGTAPLVVTWPKDKVDLVRSAFLKAAQAFWPLLLKICDWMGPRYRNYALLEGRRMGLQGLPDTPVASGEKPEGVSSPSHWNFSVMGGLRENGTPNIDVVELPLGKAEIAKLQQLLKVAYRRADSPEALAPSGLELVKASRLQNWPSWAGYMQRQVEIKAELEVLRKEGTNVESVEAPWAEYLEALGAELDKEANCRWLFHGISAEAAERVAHRDFDIDVAGAEDGLLYGRGIYLREFCSQVDRSVPEGAEGLRCMLLCRATLGNVLRDEQMLPDKVNIINQCTGGVYHGVLGDRQERSPGSVRDYVVYDRNQVYPEYLLWYRRVYQ